MCIKNSSHLSAPSHQRIHSILFLINALTTPLPPSRIASNPDAAHDESLVCRALAEAGHTHALIQEQTGLSLRQISYTIASNHAMPQKRSDRPPKLQPDQVDELVTFVCQSRATRQMIYLALASHFRAWEVSEYTIRYASRGRGFTRCVTLAKPPLSQANKEVRLRWAIEHAEYTLNQWSRILWTDETWVTGGRHRKARATR